MIVYFSGTGNSRLVAHRLSSILGDSVIDMAEHMGRDITGPDNGRVVWVFPVHSWGMPLAVRRFIKSLPAESIPEGTAHFMVATCGDDAGLTHRKWRKAILKRGWTPIGAYTVIMPNSYVSLPGFDTDSQALTAEKLAAFPERVAQIARAIRVGAKVDDVTRGAMPALKTDIIYPAFMATLTSPRLFKCSDACVSCGRCVKHCPLGNVRLSDESGKPVWRKNCTMCLACYHACPQHAINWGPFTAGKGQYLAPSDDSLDTVDSDS